MTKKRFSLTTLAVALVLMAAASAHATTLRAFVSSTGNDANAATNCQQSAPCRTFAAAYPTVTAGGELIALDTAGYGPLTGANQIAKAITIATVPGSTAFIVAATGTAGITVAGGASDTITLRNISFNGSNAANTTGVLHNSGKLVVENCSFAQLTIGVSVVNGKADINDSRFDANTTALKSTGDGVDDQNCCSATTQVRIAGGHIRNNGTAIQAVDPGFRPASTENRKPFMFFRSGAMTTNMAGNTTFSSGSGNGCTMGCATLYVTYSESINPH